MIRKFFRLKYSDYAIEGHWHCSVNNDKVTVRITSSYVEKKTFLNVSLKFSTPSTSGSIGPCYKIELLNAKDETVFFFIYLEEDETSTVDIPHFCNIFALKKNNPDLVSGNSKNPMVSPPHIKMVLTIGTKDELLPLSSNIHKLSSIQMLRSILNETAFDDPEIEEGAIGTLIESSVDRLRNVINVWNAANILRLAQKYEIESLKEDAGKFVADNFQEVMETRGWKEMPDRSRDEFFSTTLLSLKPSKKAKLDQEFQD